MKLSAAISFSSLFAVAFLMLYSSAKPVSSVKIPPTTNRGGSSPSGTPRPFPDPEMLQHLRYLFLGAKQLGRPLMNGEMNLLPDRAKGFANSVRCFSGRQYERFVSLTNS